MLCLQPCEDIEEFAKADAVQAASSYNQELMSTEGIQTMVNAVTSLGSGGTGYVEHKILGVNSQTALI